MQHLIRREEAEAFTRSVVDEIENGFELTIRDLVEVGAFRKEKADELVDVLVAPPLPGSVRISEINLDPHLLFEFLEP